MFHLFCTLWYIVVCSSKISRNKTVHFWVTIFSTIMICLSTEIVSFEAKYYNGFYGKTWLDLFSFIRLKSFQNGNLETHCWNWFKFFQQKLTYLRYHKQNRFLQNRETTKRWCKDFKENLGRLQRVLQLCKVKFLFQILLEDSIVLKNMHSFIVFIAVYF